MTEIKLGREYYHRLRDMEQWCLDNIGNGGYGTVKGTNDLVWAYMTMFGNTTVYFRRDTDATLFALKWLS